MSMRVMTRTKVEDVPKRPPMRLHSFRCPEDIWERGKAAAEANGEKSLGDVLQRLLLNYAKKIEAEQRKKERET